MGETSIEWTDVTWSPVRGCTKVSPGCKNCYAETFAERWRGIAGHPYEQGFDLRLVPEKLAEPLKWKKPRRVFVNSMSDLFQDGVPFEFIAAVFGVMNAAVEHTFQILTKRPERMLEWFSWINARGGVGPYIRSIRIDGDRTIPNYFASSIKAEIICGKKMRAANDPWIQVFGAAACHMGTSPLPNVWLGVSCENQERADKRIPLLLQTPAAVRFVSYEPAIGPVDFTRIAQYADGHTNALSGITTDVSDNIGIPIAAKHAKLDWLICGGESGPGARAFNIQWARDVVQQCKAAGVACFVKQLGANPIDYTCSIGGGLKDRKGGDMSEWPEDLRIREFPGGQDANPPKG